LHCVIFGGAVFYAHYVHRLLNAWLRLAAPQHSFAYGITVQPPVLMIIGCPGPGAFSRYLAQTYAGW